MSTRKPHLQRGRRCVDYRPTDEFEWRCIIWPAPSRVAVVLGVGETPLLAYQHATHQLAEWAALDRLDRAAAACVRAH